MSDNVLKWDGLGRWNPSFRWDQVLPPQKKKGAMAQVKLETQSLADGVIIASGRAIHTAMTGNAAFPNPCPPLVDFLGLVDAADAKLTEYQAAVQTAEMLREEKDAAIAALIAAMSCQGAYVQAASGGDAALIMSAGMQVRSTPSPVGEPAQVLNLRVIANSMAGALAVDWDKVYGARSYEVETSPDPLGADTWGNRKTVTGSRTKLTGLTSVTRCWVRVRAIGAAGPGAWSDPAVKTVP